MVTTILMTTRLRGITYHALSVGDKGVVQAYYEDMNGLNVMLLGSQVSGDLPDVSAIDAIKAVRNGDKSHWGYTLIEHAEKALESFEIFIDV